MAARAIGTVTLACAMAVASAAAAQPPGKSWRKLKSKQPETAHASKEPFGNIRKGPVQIIISIDQQTLHLYSDGAHVTDTPVATGVPGTPDSDGRLQRDPEEPVAPFEHL